MQDVVNLRVKKGHWFEKNNPIRIWWRHTQINSLYVHNFEDLGQVWFAPVIWNKFSKDWVQYNCARLSGQRNVDTTYLFFIFRCTKLQPIYLNILRLTTGINLLNSSLCGFLCKKYQRLCAWFNITNKGMCIKRKDRERLSGDTWTSSSSDFPSRFFSW